MAPRQKSKYLMTFEDSADRLPLQWIHGFPLSNLLWDPQVFDLADIVRHIVPNLRGHGVSEATAPPYSMAMFADDCIAVLDDLGIEEPIMIGGLSMGGYVAFEICRRHPERIGGMILAATRAGADTDETKQRRDEATKLVRDQGVEAIADAMLPKLMAPQTYAKDPDLVHFVREMMLETSVDGVVGALAAMRDRHDSVGDLPLFDLPTLVIHGDEDQLIPLAEAERMARELPDAKLAVIPGAGHLPNLEQPELFDDAVREFLEGLYAE